MTTLEWIGKNKVVNHHQDVPALKHAEKVTAELAKEFTESGFVKYRIV